MSSSVAAAPSFSSTQSTAISSRRSSGTPMARASLTGSYACSWTSISAGDTLAPAVLIISVRRPAKYTYPSSS